MKRLAFGARSFGSGIQRTVKNRDVRKAYVWILLALFGMSLLVNAAGFWALIASTPIDETTSLVSKLGLWLIRIVAGLFVLLLAPLFSISVCNVLFPAFSEIPFLAGLRTLSPALAEKLDAQPGLPLTSSIQVSLRRLLVMIVIGTSCFLIALIPVAGPLVATPLQLYFGARLVGWEMLDPYFDKRQMDWVQQKQAVQIRLPEVLGMGLLCAPVLAVPLIGPLFFGILQAGAAHFVLEVMENGVPLRNGVQR